MKNKRRGFTLIELLVVVLIIGILAAVALPQYQKAITKSRLGTLKTLVSSVAASAEEVYLATGSYPSTIEELSVQPPTPDSSRIDTTYHISYYQYPWGECRLENSKGGGQGFTCINKLTGIGYGRRFEHSSILPKQASCLALAGFDASAHVCKSETGKGSPEYSISSYDSYRY